MLCLALHRTQRTVQQCLALYRTQHTVQQCLALYRTQHTVQQFLAMHKTQRTVQQCLVLHRTQRTVKQCLALYRTQHTVQQYLAMHRTQHTVHLSNWVPLLQKMQEQDIVITENLSVNFISSADIDKISFDSRQQQEACVFSSTIRNSFETHQLVPRATSPV
jgi:hypothetical protein